MVEAIKSTEAVKSTKRVRNNNGYRIFVIHPDGKIDTFEQKKAPDYLQLQKYVGGSIETVPYFKKFAGMARGIAYCNENWVGAQLPYNETASQAWKAAVNYSEKTRQQFSYEPELGGSVVFYAKIPASNTIAQEQNKLSTGQDTEVLT